MINNLRYGSLFGYNSNDRGTWYLYWYDHDDNPEMIKIERREILLLN